MPSVNINGIGVVNFPDTMSPQEIETTIRERILPSMAGPPAPQPPPERGFFGTLGARAGDVAGSLVSGVGGIATGLGGLQGVVTGDFDNTLSRAGRRVQETGESLMSPELVQKRQLLEQALKEAESQGFVAEASAAFRTLAQNPGLLASMTVEQIPQLLASFGIGRVATTAGQVAGRAAVAGGKRAAAEAGQRAGVATAVTSGAGLQGGEVASQTYQDVMNLPAATLQQSPAYQELLATMSPEEAREKLASDAGRLAGVMGGGISAATMAALPGAEKALLTQGIPRQAISRILRTGGGEAVQEGIEEGGGRASQNIAALRADVERDIGRGVAGAATTGAVLGGLMGGVSGALSRPETQATPPGAPPAAPVVPPAPPAPPTAGPGIPAVTPPPPVPPAPGAAVPPAPPVSPAVPEAQEQPEVPAPPVVPGVAAPPVPPEVQAAPEVAPVEETREPAAGETPVTPPPQFVSFNVPVGTQFPVITPPGPGGQIMSVDVVPEVVDLYSLVPASGRLQNRNIDAKANELLISKIANRPDFSQLTTSQYADRGAPVVGADNIVEVGNHRIAGLKKAAENNPEGFKAYVQSLQNAGYDTAGMQFPVLVRRRVSDLDETQRVKFVKAANKNANQTLGPVELAREDAEFLTDEILKKFDGTVDKGIEAAKNRGFVNEFITSISSGNDLSEFIDAKSGKLLPDGINRINRALFASAYNDQSLLEKAINSADDDLKSITGAMVNATSAMQALRKGVEIGRIREEFNIVPDIVRASDRIRAGRDKGMTPAEILKMEDMVSPISPLEAAIIRMMSNDDMNKVASKAAITRRLKAYAEEAATQTPDVDLVGKERRITPEQAILGSLNPDQTAMFSRGRPIETVEEPSVSPASAANPIQEYSRRHYAPIVYQDKDFAVLEGVDRNGNPVYFGAMTNGQTTRDKGALIDVDKYNGPFVPEFILDRMRQAKKDAVDRANQRVKQNPNGPIPAGSNIGFDKSFPERLRGWTSELLKELGMSDAKIFFTTFNGTRAPDYAERNSLYGDDWFRSRNAAYYREGEYYGVTISRVGGNAYTIAIKDDVRLSEQIETLAHEIGHVFDKQVFRKESDATYNEVMNAFDQWLIKNKKLPTPQYIKLLRTAVVGKKIASGYPNSPAYQNLPSYYLSFSEWFADQVARWSLVSKPAESLMGRFFQRIAAAYRKIVAAMGDVGLPNQTVAKFIEDHRKRHLLSTDPNEAPMFDPVKTKGWTKKPKQLSIEFSAGTALTQGPETEIEASRAPVNRELIESVYAGQGVAGLKRSSIEKQIVALVAGYEEGRISDKFLTSRLVDLANKSADTRRVDRAEKVISRERERGADIVREKLLAAARRGEIDPDVAEFTIWTLGKNLALANNLGISVRSQRQGEGLTIGQYNPQSEIMVVVKDAASPDTAVHEIMHHAERMMPESVQDGIRKEWAASLAKAIKKATPEQRRVLAKIPDAMSGERNNKTTTAREEIMDAFSSGILNRDEHYQLVNPSEFWAVNASRILRSRYDANSWQEKARQWLREMLAKIKGIIGARSDSPVLRGLEAVINGKGEKVSLDMIAPSRGPFAAIQQPPQPPQPTLLNPNPRQPVPPTPQPNLPLGSAADFYSAVIADTQKIGLLDRVLSTLFDKKKGESVFASIARTSINRAAPFYNLDQMAAAEGYTGRSAAKALEMALTNSGRIAQMLSHGMGRIDPATGVISRRTDVKPLIQIMREAGIKDEAAKNELQVYLAALRERDLRKVGRQGFIAIPDGAVLDAITQAEAKHPTWKQTAADMDKFNNALIDWAVDTGIVGKQQAQTLRDVFYTPFYRVMEKDSISEPGRSITPRIGESFTNVASAINRELKGGERALGDLFDNIILNADSIMKAGLKNLAMKTAAETMEFAKLGKKNLTGQKDENTITYKVDGKDVAFNVDDAVLFSALAGMPRTMQNGIYNTMAKMASIFRDFVTVAPSFIFSNLYKGKISAYVQEGQPFYTNTLAGVRDALNASTSLQNFQLQTGFGGMEYGMEPRNMARVFERKIMDEGIMKSLGKGKVLSAMRQSFNKMQELSEASEMAERIKLAENLIKKGTNPEDAYFQAYLLAPYSRRGTGEGWLGSTVQFLMPLVPFLNAKVQTTYRLIENEKGDKRRLWTLGIPQQIFLRGLVLTAFSLAAYGLNLEADEERWDDIPNYMKLNYDIIPFMGEYITLPRAFEIGQVFGALPIFVLDAIRRGEGKDLAEALVEVGKNTLWMNPLPKAIDPILGAFTNYDFFRGRPLESKGEQALPVGERVNRTTTKTGEALSATVNMVFGDVLSPIKAQALLDGYTGTLGASLMAGFDSLLSAAGAIPGKPAGAFGDPASMPAILANFAGLQRFYREDASMVSRFVGDFYKIKEMTDQLVRSQNLARQAGDLDRLAELRGEEGLPLRMRSSVNAASERIADINKRIRMIERSDRDAEDKKEAIQPLIRRRDEIARRVVDQAKNLGIY